MKPPAKVEQEAEKSPENKPRVKTREQDAASQAADAEAEGIPETGRGAHTRYVVRQRPAAPTTSQCPTRKSKSCGVIKLQLATHNSYVLQQGPCGTGPLIVELTERHTPYNNAAATVAFDWIANHRTTKHTSMGMRANFINLADY
ncbi:hypothetical protein N9L68_04845 [bacterium]|nr:hypothetical protein [bacterium]